MLRRSAGLALLVLSSVRPCFAAAAAWENVPVAGGIAGLTRSLDMSPAPDRARALAELAHAIYVVPEGRTKSTDALLERLSAHLAFVGKLQAALNRVQPGDRPFSLSMASRGDWRNALKDLLELTGLRLKQSNKRYVLERASKQPDAAREQLLRDLGVDVPAMMTRLNGGEAIRIQVPVDMVPVPLGAAAWSQSVFGRAIPPPSLFAAIIGDRQAALLCHGLSALDDETLLFLAAHADVLKRLYEHDAAAFAVFGSALHVRGGRVVSPGDPLATELWEAALGEKAARPDRFIRELYGKDDGRAAYVYDVVAQLDPARRAFALGAWIKDSGRRQDRFKAFVDSAQRFEQLKIGVMPFARPPVDTGLLLSRVRAHPDGRPAGPAPRRFWEKVFDSADVPEDAAHELKNLHDDDTIDAAWLVEQIAVANPNIATVRLQQLSLGQRRFAESPSESLPDVLVTLRALPTYPMLVMTIDRMGIAAAPVYVAAIRQAVRLGSLAPNHAFVAEEQFQGALAMLERLVRVRRLGSPDVDALVQSLSAVRLGDNGRYDGGMARWLLATRASLFPGDDVDQSLASALAGSGRRDAGEAPVIAWEGQRYRVDFAAPELARITRTRAALSAATVDFALSIERSADLLAKADLTLPALAATVADLKRLATAAPSAGKKGYAVPPGIDPPKDPKSVIDEAVKDLLKISKPKDVDKARRLAEPLHELADVATGDALAALAYATELSDSGDAGSIVGQEHRRHDFGFEAKGTMGEQTGWQKPSPVRDANVPWHIRGSLLGLDLALAPTTLRRIGSSDRPSEAGGLLDPERETFTRTSALLNPLDLRDADLAALHDAVARGRERLAALKSDPSALPAVADAIAMDGWRRAAAGWALANDAAQLESFFSLADLAVLGDVDHAVALDRWAMAADATAACLCLAWPQPPGGWRLVSGRPQTGIMSSWVLDMTLEVALTLHELHLPASLTPAVLKMAIPDYFDRARTLHADDWLTMERVARAIDRTRIEDYVAALVSGGPLVPATNGAGGGR